MESRGTQSQGLKNANCTNVVDTAIRNTGLGHDGPRNWRQRNPIGKAIANPPPTFLMRIEEARQRGCSGHSVCCLLIHAGCGRCLCVFARARWRPRATKYLRGDTAYFQLLYSFLAGNTPREPSSSWQVAKADHLRVLAHSRAQLLPSLLCCRDCTPCSLFY